jgi:YVTN family beta-propeller protein
MRPRPLRVTAWLAAAAVVSVTAACGGDDAPIDPDADEAPDGSGPPRAVLKRPSKSSTVAVSDDDRLVVMVNPEYDVISVFDATASFARTAVVATGGEPSAVVIAPDSRTAWVANRADATVVRVVNLDSPSPVVSSPIPVGSEPTGLALSPTGRYLFVAEWGEGSVAVIDTAQLAVTEVIKGNLKNPRAIAVTNDGDQDDTDELLIVPEFFGEHVRVGDVGDPDDSAKLDRARQGRVRIYDTATFSPQTPIVFRDTADAGFGVGTSPNQLWAVAIQRDRDAPDDSGRARIYVPAVAASPGGAPRFDQNVYAMLYAGDLGGRGEITTGPGTTNLTKKVADAAPLPAEAAKLMLSEIVDLSFLAIPRADDPDRLIESDVAYVIARGADAVQRIVLGQDGITLGSTVNLQVDVIGGPGFNDGCKGPSGIVVSHDGARAYLNCWHNRRLGVVALGSNQSLTTTVAAVDAAPGAVDRGRRFFFTGRGRWSGDGTAAAEPTQHGQAWSSCGSCHPDGLTDNITWLFAAGPRQTTSMDGSFSHGSGPQVQRILNWTGIFDEMHDFERNTRGTSGGIGAVTFSPAGTCGNLASEDRRANDGDGLGRAVREDAAIAGTCTVDWDEINDYVKTIRPPRGLRRQHTTGAPVDAAYQAKIALGAQVFAAGDGTGNAGCAKCHGGDGWTVSRLFWEPSLANSNALKATAFVRPQVWPASWNNHGLQIEAEQTAPTTGPNQVACVLRDVGTFGPAALEKKPPGGAAAAVAQGARGYNVPSLYGLMVGAPYLHHGRAASLEELLDPAGPWAAHLKAGNENFPANPDQIDALIAFLLTIDATTAEAAVPAGFDGCPTTFP